MPRPRFQCRRPLLIAAAVVAVACLTIVVAGPPFVLEGHDAGGSIYGPNPLWLLATFIELYSVRVAARLSRERKTQ
jgi:hypothetical protein